MTKKKNTKQQQRTYISLFSSAGVGCYGFKLEGYECIATMTAVCTDVKEVDGSHYFTFKYEVAPEMARKGYVTVEKGSVTVNGVSLTVCNSERDSFQVAIIPYTREITNFHCIEVGTVVNLEFDIIGKYLARLMEFAL